MTKKMIKPSRAGLLVRKADGSHLAADGETLPVNAYWLRREKEGDVNITVRLFRPAKRGDADNFSKVMLDALQGHAYQNDGQITELHVYRADDKMNPRVEVEVRAA